MSSTPNNIYVVTSAADDGTSGTLRNELALAQADINANAASGDGGYFDEVTFDPSLNGQTIVVSSSLSVGSGIILDGTAGGAGKITISGNHATTVFTVPGTPAADGDSLATIQNLTIANGNGIGTTGAKGTGASTTGQNGGDAAGGIFLQGGHLSVSNDIFSGNTASGGQGGPGYYDFSSSYPVTIGTSGPSITPASSSTKGAGGNGGNAAGAIYVEPGAVVDYASGLVDAGNTAFPGLGGYGSTSGSTGSASPVSNNATVSSNTTTACFASETRIRTVRGDIAVENLAVGDLVVVASSVPRPIRWLGHRTVDCHRHPRPSDVMPVHVAAHALGDNRPARDLVVSPGHAICIDVLGEVLIPACALVNGSTIRQVDVEKITYWHVELDSHDILLAENLPTESYLDMGNRGFFAESDVIALAAAPDAASTQSRVFDLRPPFDGAGQASSSRTGPRITAQDDAAQRRTQSSVR